MKQVKEDLCYLSKSFLQDLENAKARKPVYDINGSSLKKEFVLPDFHRILKGYVRGDDEMLTERDQVCQ